MWMLKTSLMLLVLFTTSSYAEFICKPNDKEYRTFLKKQNITLVSLFYRQPTDRGADPKEFAIKTLILENITAEDLEKLWENNKYNMCFDRNNELDKQNTLTISVLDNKTYVLKRGIIAFKKGEIYFNNKSLKKFGYPNIKENGELYERKLQPI